MAHALAEILIFPGFLFLGVLGMAAEFVDRKLYARFQNRQGPPWYQPLADFIKLAAKEEIIPAEAAAPFFKLMPVVALAAVVTSVLYIPLWSTQAVFAFEGDLIVVIYLLTIPTLTFFLGGWFSTSLFATIGAVRTLTQLFAYEVPLFLALLSPAVLAGTWSLSGMATFFSGHWWLSLLNVLGLVVALTALQGKLERVPFDIPEAETEVVGGAFTEYNGPLLALYRITIDIELVVGASLIAAVFLPFGLGVGGVFGFLIYVLKVLGVVFLSALARSVMARLRIEQMIDFCWKWVAPAALLQLLICILALGVMAA